MNFRKIENPKIHGIQPSYDFIDLTVYQYGFVDQDFMTPDRLSDIGIPMMSDNLLLALKSVWCCDIECALINTY